jgi:deoxycytidylate deaminase
MAVPRSKQVSEISVRVTDLFAHRTSAEAVTSTRTDEIIIVLCGPIGSPMHDVSETIKVLLESKFGYASCNTIRMSKFIAQYAGQVDLKVPSDAGFKRINAQIDAGNRLRAKYGANVLAELAVDQIRKGREKQKVEGGSLYKPRRVCHVVDSIKNQDEMDLLREVYGESVYFVGVFAPQDIREANLSVKGLAAGEVYRLFDRDSGEESATGQTIRDTFPQCDFFVRIDSTTDSQLETRVERFISLILQSKIITPTEHESAMYAAASAAVNSACLSRQVGAAITDAQGLLVSVGWNDVPQYGGGLYSAGKAGSDSENDKRCWNREGGKCFNDQEKEFFAEALVAALSTVIKPKQRAEAQRLIRESGKLKNLIEFSRSVHAEMHAIINAGRSGSAHLDGATMYVTTYPCHSCARHIIAAGISKVVYIEPYRKSLAVKLHGDAISENEHDADKVRLLCYEGVAPSKYQALFKMQTDTRKINGRMTRVSGRAAVPRLSISFEGVPSLEDIVARSLARKKIRAIVMPNGE